MVIYGENCKKKIKNIKLKSGLAVIAATVAEALIITLCLSVFTKENYIIFELVLSFATLLYVTFCFLTYKLKASKAINLDKLLKKYEEREPDTVLGTYVSDGKKIVSDSKVSFAVLLFDTGAKYCDDVVLRELLLESTFENPFKENEKYRLKVIDNVITEYEHE